MKRTKATSGNAAAARELVESLQQRFVEGLEAVSRERGVDQPFARIEWYRDGGRHGGGVRHAVAETPVFNRGSVNVSHVHYDDLPQRKLSSATAISTIIHPEHPRAPSVHIHVSWTEMRDGKGYWRMMADLNPAIEDPDDTRAFERSLEQAAPDVYADGRAQGERYFFIPVLGRHRGVTHFYLEGYGSGDFATDARLAQSLGRAAIDGYLDILGRALDRHGEASDADRAAQLSYHTLYLLQVLTLDRGTTSGLLVHDQNDVGIMGSLPSYVDRDLLLSWQDRMPAPQDELVRAIAGALAKDRPSHVTDEVRARLARVVREHYRAHPEALALQARGDVIPPTVDNHS